MPITMPRNLAISGTLITHSRALPAMPDRPTPIRTDARNGLLDDAVVLIHSASHDLHARSEKALYRDCGRPTLEEGTQRRVVHRERVIRHVIAQDEPSRESDIDLLMTTNNGPAVLFRNDHKSGNRGQRDL
jgi:hypothetical protein